MESTGSPWPTTAAEAKVAEENSTWASWGTPTKKESLKERRAREKKEREERERLDREANEAAEAAQSNFSPYTSSPVALLVGPNHIRFYVPPLFLQNPAWIAYYSSGNEIHLPDVDESTGHVLVHYLYTGTYQTLDNVGTSSAKEETHAEFKSAVLAYVAAKTYELSTLQQLAMHKIEHYSTKMNILDVIEVIDNDFLTLSGDSKRFRDYLHEKIKAAFEEDYAAFARNDFFGRITNVALNKFLMKAVVELYTDKLSRVLDTERGSCQALSGEYVPAAQDLPVEEPAEVTVPIEEPEVGIPAPSAEELAPSAEELAAPAEEVLLTEEPTLAEEAALPPEELAVLAEEATPTDEPQAAVEEAPLVEEALAEDPVAVQPVIDMSFGNPSRFGSGGHINWTSEWGSTTSWTAQIEPAPEPALAEEVGGDSWGDWGFTSKKKKETTQKTKKVYTEEALPLPPPPESELAPEPALAEEVKSDDWSGWGCTSKKKQKGKKGKMEYTEEAPPPPEPEPEPEPALAEEVKSDEWSDWRFTSKKKGKKTKMEYTEEAPPPPEPVPEQTEEKKDDGDWGSIWGVTSKKKKKGKKNPPPPPLEPEPEPEQTEEKHDDGSWGSIWGVPSKKNIKKKKKGYIELAPPPSLPPEPEPEPEQTEEKNEDGSWEPTWGVHTTKTHNNAPPDPPPAPVEPSPPSFPATEAAPAEEVQMDQANAESVSVINGEFQSVSEQRVDADGDICQSVYEHPVPAEDDICPARAKHLLEGDMWKHCRQCRTMLRQVAIQLARTGYADDDGYEIVDRVLVGGDV